MASGRSVERAPSLEARRGRDKAQGAAYRHMLYQSHDCYSGGDWASSRANVRHGGKRLIGERRLRLLTPAEAYFSVRLFWHEKQQPSSGCRRGPCCTTIAGLI